MTHKRQTDNETDSTEKLKVRHTRTFIDRQTGRQTDRQTDRQTHTQTDKQTDRQTDKQLSLTDADTHTHTRTHTHTQTDRQSNPSPHPIYSGGNARPYEGFLSQVFQKLPWHSSLDSNQG